MPGGKSIEWSSADVRIYNKKAFDAILLDVKNKAEETERSILDVVLQERDRLENELHFHQMDKEQTQRAKETAERMLTQYPSAYADEFRKNMLSFSEKLKAIETTIEQDQKALDDIANKEAEARRIASRELLVRTVLGALPKPVEEVKGDAHGKFQVHLKSEDDYVVVTNASSEAPGDFEFYRTTIRRLNGETPGTILLSLYDWNTEAK
jgi:hypothetical protein